MQQAEVLIQILRACFDNQALELRLLQDSYDLSCALLHQTHHK